MDKPAFGSTLKVSEASSSNMAKIEELLKLTRQQGASDLHP